MPEHPLDSHISDKEKILSDLYDRIDHERAQIYVHPRYGPLILRYVEIVLKDTPEIDDPKARGGGMTILCGPFGLNEKIFVFSDIVPEKYRRYVAIHEVCETIHHNHWWAIQDEFQAAEQELSAEEYKQFIRWRMNFYKDNIKTLKEIQHWVSGATRKIIKELLKRI